jgi:ABC-type uncharacterized transport system auxiliary subunit
MPRVASLKMMSPEPSGSTHEVASVNVAGENPVTSIVAPTAGRLSSGPEVTKTELVFPPEVTVNDASLNEVVPKVPVAKPENVNAIGSPNAAVAVNPMNSAKLNGVFMVA